jgi:hypothetical protein
LLQSAAKGHLGTQKIVQRDHADQALALFPEDCVNSSLLPQAHRLGFTRRMCHPCLRTLFARLPALSARYTHRHQDL